MKNVLLLVLSMLAFQLQSQNYSNPILPGFNPDPSICKVEDDYYVVTSSFEYFPGVPIYHSKDLVNWKMIGHALPTAMQLQLDSANCSAGIYAPTIRYYKGVFYMITTLSMGGLKKGLRSGNFIVTATNIKGPWSEPHWIANAPGIDPSLFFDDDGKVYYIGNTKPLSGNLVWNAHRNIWVQELDLKEWKLVGNKVEVLDGSEFYQKGTLDGGITNGVNNYEGPHIYKKDNYYYLLVSHGGTAVNHAVSIWKSKSIWGDYKINPNNPILTNRDIPNDTLMNATGHADLIQTQRGEWWMVYLAKRPFKSNNFVLGRETFMSPVDWSGEFPVVNATSKNKVGHGELVHSKPNLKEFKQSVPQKDEFIDSTLQPEWTFIRTPRTKWWSLTEKKGSLCIKLRPEIISERVNPSFIGKRIKDMKFEASTKLDFNPMQKEEAGMVVIRDRNHYFKFVITANGNKKALKLIQKTNENGVETETISTEIGSKSIFIKIEMNRNIYNFMYSFDNKSWNSLKSNEDGNFLGEELGSFYTGSMIGLYTSSNGNDSNNKAFFDWFEMK